jgi:hypothetical protein
VLEDFLDVGKYPYHVLYNTSNRNLIR